MVIWNLSFNTDTIINGWPATPLEAMAKDPIRDFILARYRLCTTLHAAGFRYVVLARRDPGCDSEGRSGRP
jgi:hypothetical protein